MSAGGTDAALRARLIDIIKARSFQSGQEVKLASGQHLHLLLQHEADDARRRGRARHRHAHPRRHRRPRRRSHRRPGDGCRADRRGRRRGEPRAATSRSTPSSCASRRRSTAPSSLIEGLPDGESLQGKRVVVVEDVTTTGGSAIKAAEALRAEGAEVVGVVTVHRPRGRRRRSLRRRRPDADADPHARRTSRPECGAA